MNVLHLSWDPLSGAPYRLVQVLRLAGVEARLVSEDRRHGGRRFPHDLLYDAGRELLAELIDAADVVHYHNWWRNNRFFAAHPWAWERVAGKPSVIQFHSPRGSWHEEALAEPSLVKLVVAQFHVRLYPECRPVPNALPIDDELHRPAGVENLPPKIAYTPPILGVDDAEEGWYRKGYRETMEVLSRGFDACVVFDRPWEEAMAARRRCDVAIDEVITGSYHLCSLEALSQGLATVANLDAATVDAIEAVTGTRRHPWIVADPGSLHRVLSELVADHDLRREKRREARAWMERHWSPAAVASHFLAAYEEALERRG
ncbi:MAG TPA: hypothetical protein VHM02_05170 [Thermoanaerobaculia bacterium]|nr:hypothetical protein [Thermoanaerobaculia bacterium]